MDDRRALSIPEVCERSGAGRTRIYEEIRAGRLIANKIGSRTIIWSDNLAAWMSGLPRVHPSKVGTADSNA